MTLNESVAKLHTLLPNLKASDANFAASLIASFTKYGSLTPKQAPWIEKLIVRAEAPVAPVVTPFAVTPGSVNVGGFAGVLALFSTAKAHLKFPKIRLSLNGTKIVLSLNGLKSKKPGFVSISGEGVYPNKAFYGSVSPEGVFTPFKSELPGLTALLTELSSNPARVAKDHGKLTGNCCFCNKVLGLGKEQRSVLVGFGPDCAEHYGLKAEWLAAADKAEAKASVAPLKLEGPWLGSANAPTVEPTLMVTPAAQEAIDTLAESLAKATGAVSVTVTDGPATATHSTEPVNTDELQAELGPDYILAEACGDTGEDDTVVCTFPNGHAGPHSYDEVAVEKEYGSTVAALLTPEPKATCFFCEEQTAQYASLHGYTVCSGCAAQLTK